MNVPALLIAAGNVTSHRRADMKMIPLTQGKSAIVDDQDYEYLSQFKWHYHYNGYAIRQTSRRLPIKRTTVSMHREIMNPPDDMEIDHVNGNKLDNRRCNLRVCTSAENKYNRGVYFNNTSGMKGVTFNKKEKKYKVSIRIGNNKRLHLGYFIDLREAALAYNKAAKKYHGEFAKLNKVEDER
jgi:hypothetical protein